MILEHLHGYFLSHNEVIKEQPSLEKTIIEGEIPIIVVMDQLVSMFKKLEITVRIAILLPIMILGLCSCTPNGSDIGPGTGTDGVTEEDYCPVGSVITAITPEAGVARVGSVYSSTQYDPTDLTESNDTHNPQQIEVRVTDGTGDPVPDCRVFFHEADGSGWVFPDTLVTDDDGRIKAWWTAGSDTNQTTIAKIYLNANEISSATITGTAEPHSTRANSIHINYGVNGIYDRFRVDVTPITFPTTTYYSTINFPGGYTGIQNRGDSTNPTLKDKWVLFSVWDTKDVDAEIIYHDEAATCEGFGGEGTGAKCHIEYDWEIGDTYRFELEVTYPVASRTDYTLYFSDVSNGSDPIKVATLRYGAAVTPSSAAGFIEDWWATGSSCLTTETRAAYFHNIAYKRGDADWTYVTQSTPSAVYKKWHNEICKNYYFAAEGDKFLWSTGGDQYVGPPLVNSNYGDPVTLE